MQTANAGFLDLDSSNDLQQCKSALERELHGSHFLTPHQRHFGEIISVPEWTEKSLEIDAANEVNALPIRAKYRIMATLNHLLPDDVFGGNQLLSHNTSEEVCSIFHI